MHWRRKWQPTPVFLPGESQGEPGGLPQKMKIMASGPGTLTKDASLTLNQRPLPAQPVASLGSLTPTHTDVESAYRQSTLYSSSHHSHCPHSGRQPVGPGPGALLCSSRPILKQPVGNRNPLRSRCTRLGPQAPRAKASQPRPRPLSQHPRVTQEPQAAARCPHVCDRPLAHPVPL